MQHRWTYAAVAKITLRPNDLSHAVKPSCGQAYAVKKSYGHAHAVKKSCGQAHAVKKSCGQAHAVKKSCGQAHAVKKSCGQAHAVKKSCAQVQAVKKSCGQGSMLCSKAFTSSGKLGCRCNKIDIADVHAGLMSGTWPMWQLVVKQRKEEECVIMGDGGMMISNHVSRTKC